MLRSSTHHKHSTKGAINTTTKHKQHKKKKQSLSTTTTHRKFSTTAAATSADPTTITIPTQSFDFGHHEKRWNTEWNIAQPSRYSNPDEYTPQVHDKDVTAVDNAERPAFYSLSMFPYPSGDLHMGHVRVYTISDCLSRYYKHKGFNVIHPMGWDAFGLPAENAARERNISPETWTYSNLKHMRKQLNSLGVQFDWDREVATCHEDYYKWTQWIFVQLYKMGLAYRKKATVNWDPIDETVLANEQVDADGKSWRSGAVVERRDLYQWFFKITDYAEDLLQGVSTLDQWPQTVKVMQSQWIGKKNSAHVDFGLYDFKSKFYNNEHLNESLLHSNGEDGARENYTAFTTRPDTLLGVTYVAILPTDEGFKNHLLKLKKRVFYGEKIFTKIDKKLITTEWINECLQFAEGYDERKAEFNGNQRVVVAKHRGAKQQKSGQDDAEVITSGLKTPVEMIHPITGEAVPLFMADYVEKGRGTGVVMGVPAHDYNDFAFAKQHDLPVKVVISASKEANSKQNKALQDNVDENGFVLDKTKYQPHVTQTGTMINSSAVIKQRKKKLTPTGTEQDAATQQDEEVEEEQPFTLNDVDASTAALNVIDQLSTLKKGKASPSYQLHDWLVSRQRYWGTPIPIIYCKDGCGPQPVPEDQLPVSLPRGIPLDVKGRSPLASSHPEAEAWRQCSCPSCGSENAERETDTLDTFIDSSWYFLRYLSSETHRHNEQLTDQITGNPKYEEFTKKFLKKNQTAADVNKNFSLKDLEATNAANELAQKPTLPWNIKETNELYPVTQYIGGIEHAILHLLYSRFISYALYDAGLVKSKEPFKSLLTQGMVHGESYKHPQSGRFIHKDNVIVTNEGGQIKAFTKEVDAATQEVTKGLQLDVVWEKMSKSKGNGVNPDDMVKKYGADVCRLFMLFKAPPEKVLDWDEKSVQGMSRWVNRLSTLVQGFTASMDVVNKQGKNKNVLPTNINPDVFDNAEVDDGLVGKLPKAQGIEKMQKELGRELTEEEQKVMAATAQCINDVTFAMETRAFNVGIARMMALSNELFAYLSDKEDSSTESGNSAEWNFNHQKLQSPVFRNAVITLLRLLSPIAPHFTSESFLQVQSAYYNIPYDTTKSAIALGEQNDNIDSQQQHHIPPGFDLQKVCWPKFDPSWAEQKANAVVQLNGKLLFSFDTARDLVEQPDGQVLAALCKLDAFTGPLLQKLPKEKLLTASKGQAQALFDATNGEITDEMVNKAFKRVVTKTLSKTDKILVNFVM